MNKKVVKKAVKKTAKKKAGSNPVGRPSEYTPEIAAELCFRLSQGKSLRTVCLDADMPSGATVFKWMRDNEEFLKQYTRAKEEAMDAMAEDIQDIADETNQVIKSGAEKKSGAYAQAQKLRIDTRKWLMSKIKPKKYGDRLDLTTDGEKLPAPIYGGQASQAVKPKKTT